LKQWQPPPARVRELIRRGAEIALNAPPRWYEEIDAATLAGEGMAVVASDPVLLAALRRTNRANLRHWAAANVAHPGEPVAPNLGEETLGIARDLVRRGATVSALDSYRVGQNAAWIRWMSIVFELTSDPAELRQLLDVSARSIAAFVDATITGIAAQMEAERDELTRGSHAERREVVTLILEGAPISPKNAAHRLRYNLEQRHRAAIVWSEETGSDLAALEQAAVALSRAVGVPQSLTVIASAATLWVWVPGDREPNLDQVRATLHGSPGVRVAVGSVGDGVDGFRRSHLDALTTQRMLSRLRSHQRIASIGMVRLVSLITQDAEGAEQFVRQTLGALESAAPQLRLALLTFLKEGCNASRAAARLHTHRNTLLRRLDRAAALLPQPLDRNRVDVAAALEVLRWRPGGA
jgi:DNA-binding PucR family transcriptional regulator